MKKIMVFGTFDGLHDGHLDFFRQAKEHGDYLVVIIARDLNVKKIKNRVPINDESERLKIVKKCNLVDEAILGYEGNPYKIIREIKPDVICLGYDQSSFTNGLKKKLKELGLKTKVYKMKPYKPEKYHSSLINK